MEWLSSTDPSSFSKPEECVVSTLHLDWDVDFVNRIIKGQASITAKKTSPKAQSLILDTSDLKIKGITCGDSCKPAKYEVGQKVLSFGSPLTIYVPEDAADEFSLVVDYETSPSCMALQWLNPEQTSSKEHPYLYSQCHAIHARSLLPCQDSPGVKMPYTATVSASSELTVLMSAIKMDSEANVNGRSVHKFEQTIPIPSYLIAIVVAALESRTIGPRSKVWSEKDMVDVAANEFSETEQMLATAENLLGPYVWGPYDLLVLPPAFPYGGAENPCLTFVTPTILAGDRSLSLIVAHELVHSWMGNLVTNKNSEHFWLNEGHTVFMERKIAGRMNGESFRHLLAFGGWNHLQNQIEDVLTDDHPFSCLVLDLNGVHPDDAFSSVPYEKGSAFLMYLEQKLGGPDVFEPFLKAYVERFKYKSLTTDEWKQFLYEYFHSKKAILDKVDWKSWLYGTGMPPVKPKYDMSLTDAHTSLAAKWIRATDFNQFSAADIKGFSAYQLKDFLELLPSQPPMSAEKISNLNKFYGFDAIRNSEIKFRWLRLCLAAKLDSYVASALKFVTEQGRMKFVRPLYRDLYNWEASRQKAIENYEKTKSQMHPVTATMVGKDLRLIT